MSRRKLVLYSRFPVGAALRSFVPSLLRKFATVDYHASPQWLFILELVADGATLVLFVSRWALPAA